MTLGGGATRGDTTISQNMGGRQRCEALWHLPCRVKRTASGSLVRAASATLGKLQGTCGKCNNRQIVGTRGEGDVRRVVGARGMGEYGQIAALMMATCGKVNNRQNAALAMAMRGKGNDGQITGARQQGCRES